jgi:hypothetical protein
METDDSGLGQKSVTFARNRRSPCSGMTGHLRPESPVTLTRNRRSPSSGIHGHVGPEYAWKLPKTSAREAAAEVNKAFGILRERMRLQVQPATEVANAAT